MSELIDCVFVSTNPYTEKGRVDRSPEDCFRFCMEVTGYADRASEFGFGDHEMPRPLIHVQRATDVVLRSESFDDLEDFFKHIEWSEVTVEETIEAMRAIGADDHARLLATVNVCLKSLRYKVNRSNLKQVRDAIDNAAKEHLSATVLQARYGDFGVEGDSDLDRRWRSICLQATRYMDGWTNIKRVPDGPFNQAELKKYFEAKLETARRLKKTKTEGPDGSRGEYASGVVEVQNTRAFVLASLNGDDGTVHDLLANGANVNARLSGNTASLPGGATALMAAAARGHIETVKILLAAKANLEARANYKETALILAAREGRVDVVEALLGAKANVNAEMRYHRTALLEASDRLHLKIVKALIAAGANVNGKPGTHSGPLLFACSRVYEDWARREGWPVDHLARIGIVRALLAAGADVNEPTAEGNTPLIIASGDGFLEVVKELLVAGADVNARNGQRTTALLSALRMNRADVAQFLIAAKADVHAVSGSGDTTLMLAADYGHLDLVQTFLDADVNVNAVDKRNFTALMGAARGGYMEVLTVLLAAGADVNTITHAGTTALFLSAMNGHLDVVRTLVAANADTGVKTTHDGTTALMIAAEKGHQEVVQLLQTLQRPLN